jgi:endoglucanase
MKRHPHDLLLRLMSQPTAPFREYRVAAVALDWLARQRLPHFIDPAGNIVIGADSARDYRKLLAGTSPEPARLFIAHMDHPGFHGVRWRSATRLAVQWHGGSPRRGLSHAPVWLATPGGEFARGRLSKPKLSEGGHGLAQADVILDQAPEGKPPRARDIYGAFHFGPPYRLVGQRLYTRVADDLVGVYAVLQTARQAKRLRRPFLGLLTRGEEVGFVGALAHFDRFRLATARRPLLAVSLETSRVLPGTKIGGGPIVRLGDRRTVFDPGYTQQLLSIAARALPGRHQRRIMDGGTCEATAALASGIPAIGISVPLGNYHNEAFEGAPGYRRRGAPAPEFVHLSDVRDLRRLCEALLAPDPGWRDPWKPTRERLAKNRRRYRRFIRR